MWLKERPYWFSSIPIHQSTFLMRVSSTHCLCDGLKKIFMVIFCLCLDCQFTYYPPYISFIIIWVLDMWWHLDMWFDHVKTTSWSCYTHDLMWHPWFDHVTSKIWSCDIHDLIIWQPFFDLWQPLSDMWHPWSDHVTPMIWSCDTHDLIMWHPWLEHVTTMIRSCDNQEWTMWYNIPRISELIPILLTNILSVSSEDVNSSATTYSSDLTFLASAIRYCAQKNYARNIS